MTNEKALQRAKELTGSKDYIYQQLKKEGFKGTREDVRHWLTPKMICTDNKQATEIDMDAYISQIEAFQESQQTIDQKQVKAHYQINDDKPILIVNWGDWHLGASGTDYKTFNKHLEIIANTDGLYWLGMGDYKDNYLPRMPFGGNEQIVTPDDQSRWVINRVKKVAHNNLGFIRGCHEDFSHSNGDEDFIQVLCNITKQPNLWHGADLYIKVNDIEYHERARHKYKYESALNVENSTRQMIAQMGECDIACVAHLHTPFVMQRELAGAERTLMRSGSYKIWDEHGQKLAGYKGKAGAVSTMLFPDKKKIIAFKHLEDAVVHLKALRA